jgi:hypothetical protein
MNKFKYKQILRSIEELSSSLSVNESTLTTCLFCEQDYEDQGSPRFTWKPEKSLSITRTDVGILYNCFRASCNKSGFIGTLPSLDRGAKAQPKKEFKPKQYTHELLPLPKPIVIWIQQKYGITKEELEENEVKWQRDGRRLYVPIYSQRSSIDGAVTKSVFRTKGDTKSLVYRFAETSGMYYPKRTRECLEQGTLHALVIVEDFISAIKVSRYVPCISLQGTHISPYRIMELQGVTNGLILMLDQDASDKAFYYKKKYGIYFRKFEVIPMVKDPKDTDDNKLKEVLHVI